MHTEGTGKKIIFACVHNAGRSQMAAAWLNALVAPGQVVAVSAGTAPAQRVHPEVVSVMRELKLDLSQATPQCLTPEMVEEAALLVTMGCGEACPQGIGVRVVDWPLDDPKNRSLDDVRRIRDEIRMRVEQLIADEGLRRKEGADGGKP